jgi:hypothetical protein
MAAFRILGDLAEKGDDSNMTKILKEILKPGKEREFWGTLHSAANFFKHAEKDLYGILDDVDESVNDSVLCLTCFYCKDLGYHYTAEMSAFLVWYTITNPDFLNEQVSPQWGQLVESLKKNIRSMSRTEQLSVGQQFLEAERVQPRRK